MSDSLLGGPAAEVTTAPPATETTGGQTGQTVKPGTDWAEGLPDDLRGLTEAKGWKEPADVLKSYKHLEGMIGAEKAGRTLLMPKDSEDTASLDPIYKALGRPDKPDEYGLGELFGDQEVNSDLLGTMAPVMHEAGLSKAQAQKLAKAYDGLYQTMAAAEEQRYAAEQAALEKSLPPEKLENARRAFRLFGLPENETGQVARAVENALGMERAVDLFASLGRRLGEDRTVDGAETVSGVSTPAGAQRRMDERLGDPHFRRRYMAGEESAVAEIEELSKRTVVK